MRLKQPPLTALRDSSESSLGHDDARLGIGHEEEKQQKAMV
jgi:hypothetical protein